ncbi:hypothetical protein M430DRAFT_37760 [Amorphotheca resinae ATCC 22711]|uniref:MIT domain-containing protein n=1 Tax=Amorphotheca resinae ATCC 22711 TaxID=857342 RepID=A0A2T3AP14_AMORE|nr:hypothetical protein M430DRAFT_37760 [Amorphotheca resinae ATCC 22711]PSS06669.1 hypothetical protein M430DRAFT_37760 [Amorphotheca resinae ATCC 22711]
MQKLADNQDLERRLELVGAQLQQNTLRDSVAIYSDYSDGSDLTVCPKGTGTLDAYLIQHEFEETLYASWVYRRNQSCRESMSIRSSVVRQSAWSVLSELSLAQISIISVIALPVQRSELFNAQWYTRNENQGEEAKDDCNTGRLALGSKIQQPGSSPGNQNTISCEEQYGLSNTGDEGSANTLENTEVNQDMLKGEGIDSDIAEIELPLQGTAHTLRSDHQNPGNAHTGRNTLATNPEIHAVLSKALQKANIAVLRDNNNDYSSAIDSYTDACNLLGQVIEVAHGVEDVRKLESIKNTYFSRITELELLPGRAK